MSMLILTRRVLTGGTGIMRHVAAFLMFIVATDALIFCFVVIFTCRQVSHYHSYFTARLAEADFAQQPTLRILDTLRDTTEMHQ
jgi:hypothetical protein